MKKRIVGLFLILLMIPISINAKTLGEYKAELDELERTYADNQAQIARTDEEIASAKARVNEIYGEIDTIEADMVSINNEIAKLNEEILSKDKEIKELMKYYQFTNGESAYLEYLFKADSINSILSLHL